MSAGPVDFHALLIGIDSYPPPFTSLEGCINDIDAVEDLLVRRLGVAPSAICRLTTQPSQLPPPAAQERLPTYDKIVAALRELARPPVMQGSRVLVYYAGHGSIEWRPQSGAYLEGLATLNQGAVRLLYDIELNHLLQQIANRGADLTVVLDCCHAAGATRATDGSAGRVRCLPPQERYEAAYSDVIGGPLECGVRGGGLPQPQNYTVLAACHADEQATELWDRDCPGRARGALSYCLLSLLGNVSDEELCTLRFSDIWELLRAEMTRHCRRQNPWLLGPASRRIFAGPWSKRDDGFPIRECAGNAYLIGGGLLAGLAPGAKVAVFGEEPAQLPPAGSEEEQRVRLGLLVVESADLASARARPEPGQPHFAVPLAARVRLVQLPQPARLTISGCESLAPNVAELLRGQAAAGGYVLLPAGTAGELVLQQRPNGSVWLVDDGCGASNVDRTVFPVGVIPLDHPTRMAAGLHAALAHYEQFLIPLRLCQQASMPLQLAPDLRIFSCPAIRGELPLSVEQCFSPLRELPRSPSRYYLVGSGAPVCIEVQNATERSLFVSVLVCNLEGQVQVIDTNVFIARQSIHRFWSGNVVGEPFRFVCPGERPWAIDRLVLISSEQRGIDLSLLAQDRTLQQAIDDAMAGRTLLIGSPRQPLLPFWSASQSVLQIVNQATAAVKAKE